MKPFKFSLDSVVLVRELELKRAEAAYGEKSRKRAELEEKLDAAKHLLADLLASISKGREKPFHGPDQHFFRIAELDRKNEVMRLQNHVDTARTDERRALHQYLQIKSGLEKLLEIKERNYREHVKNEMLREEKQIEEIINARYRNPQTHDRSSR